jgi:nitrous oxidase accessory protein NosD
VQYKGIDVFAWTVPPSRITYESPMVSWINAAHWDNMSYAEFSQKSPQYQSLILAAYYATNQAEAVKAWQERPKSKK